MRSHNWFFRVVAPSIGAVLVTVLSLSCGDDATGPSGGFSADLQQAAQSITAADVATHVGVLADDSMFGR